MNDGAPEPVVLGWDIGGAHVKVATVRRSRVLEVAQFPCPPAAHRGKFDQAMRAALEGRPPARHAVTMTGELSDVFASRAEGVDWLVGLASDLLGDEGVSIYGGRAGFLAPDEARQRPLDVASANWHASASLVGRRIAEGMLVDIGSTTADLIPISAGRSAAAGYTDAERLASSELVYTGVVRTPVMAVARTAPFSGVMQGLAAERFATMADVYRITADLTENADQGSTADGRTKSRGDSIARLARMTGRDAADAPDREWDALAQFLADAQLSQLVSVAGRVVERSGLGPLAPIVGAGCGRFLAQALARRLDRPYQDFAGSIDAAEGARGSAACCAPAVSVALLPGSRAPLYTSTN